ncbi:MAG TPA: flagellar biosynthetic protein FliR [candidate division Zixibacteria bacterium]|nr:flagellar biosynthetic protein FliR [candidate division Zixibacteria bacterium]
MFDFINYGADKLILMLLIMVRASGIFVTAPIYGDRSLPRLVKVGLVILLSLILIPVVGGLDTLPKVTNLWQLTGLVFNEMLVGVLIGLVYRLIFIGVLSGGAIIGYQVGFSFANVFDPNQSDQISIIGRFWYILAILFFLTINGHHIIISSFADSYQVIPAGNVQLSGAAGELFIKYTAYIFIIAVKIASPVIITLFLTDVALGTIAKTMPTMNVFFVGFPIKIGAGLLVMALSLPLFTYVIQRSLEYFDGELHTLLMTLGRA